MAALRSVKAKALFIYNPQDGLFPPSKIELQARTIPNARAVAVDSLAGHTIWYNADPQATVALSNAMKTFLTDLTASRTVAR